MLHKIIILIYLSFSICVLYAQTQVGKASFYADKFDGRHTASGEIFKQNKLTAAHRTLAFGTKVKVTNLANKKTVVVRINDRGPFSKERLIDLSKSAARKLDFIRNGVAKVKIEVLGRPNRENAKNHKQTKSKKPRKKEKNKELKKEKKHSKTPDSDYYELDKKRVSPKGFGIQVASYHEKSNLIKRCKEIKKKTKKKVFVKVSQKNGQEIYRIILGSFSTRDKANRFNKKIRNQFKGSFVLAF